MKTKHLFISFALGLGLALALLWYVGGRGSRAIAAPHSEANCDDPQPILYLTISPTVKNGSCTSIYTLTNQGFAVATMVHDLYDQDDQLIYNMDDTLGVGASRVYDLLDIGLLPEGYSGYVIISSDQPLTYTLDTCPVRLRTCWARVNDNLVDYTTVQAAVDAANEGDTVKVAGTCTGVHVRPRDDITTTGTVNQVVYVSKTVTIQGGYTTTNWTTPDPEANPTTLDAQGLGRVLYITGDISPTIQGLRITGGDATGLGGESFWGQDAGGGVFVISATATMRDNQVFSNTAENGGGLFLHTCSAEVSENAIIENTSSGEGGGIGVWGSDAVFNDNVINYNTSSWGGGLYLHSSNATISNNTISANAATGRGGGGLFLWWSNATLAGNRISDNTSPWNTNGGLHVFSSAPVLTNNAIVGNQSGGMQVEGDAHPRLVHNTITNNGTDGVGLYVTGYTDIFGTPMYSSIVLTNTLLVSHGVGISVTGGNTVTVNGALWHNTPVTVSQSPTAVVSVQNEHAGDPAFAADGYHITPASAAMDVGVDAGVTTDIDGHVRPYNAIPDLGADEIIATLVPTDTESTLAYTDTQGLATTVQVPADAVTETVALAYTPVEAASPPSGFTFAGRAFDLDAYQGETLLASFFFSKPVTITLYYDEGDLGGVDEETLVLDYWDGDAWVDAACGAYDRHPAEDWLAVPICHLSRFAVFGERRTVYLPLVVRDY